MICFLIYTPITTNSRGFYLILYRLTLLQYLILMILKVDSSLLDSNSLINLIKFEDLTLNQLIYQSI
jgi:hypothetical protein